MELLRQLGVNCNTAWRLHPKLRQAMRDCDDSQPLHGTVELDDAYLSGEAAGRRGRGAAGKTPCLAAAPGNPEGNPDRVRLTPGPGCRKEAARRWARRHLLPGTGVRSAGLGCFRGVRDAGCAPRPTVTGGGQGSCETPGLQGVHTLPGNVQRSLDAILLRLAGTSG